MNYIYACASCERKAVRKFKSKLISDGNSKTLPAEIYAREVLFETSHGMKPKPEELKEATKCPRCGGHDCQKSFHGFAVTGYIRGYGWMDKSGVNRDMNLYHLDNKDPYAEHRVDGEVDHIKSQLKKAGKHQTKPIYSVGKSSTPKKPTKKK